MITSLRDYDSGTVIETDLCIVGAGPAGITIAREFSGCGVNVCLVESGGLQRERRTQRLSAGEVSGINAFSLAGTRDRVFGGTTYSWAGYCTPLWPIDLERRPWVPHSGWPIALSDLLPYYERAQSMCDLGTYDYEAPAAAGSAVLQLDREKLGYALWQHSPPTRFGAKYRHELEASANVRVLLHANATRIGTEANRSRVTGIDVSTLEGRTARIRASAVVLAAGGIENARLLLLSADDAAGGLANEHGLVGRFFMEHVYLRAGVLTPRRSGSDLDAWESFSLDGRHCSVGIVPSPQAQAQHGLLNGYLVLVRGLQDRHAGYLALSRLKRAIATTSRSEHLRQDLWDVLTGLGDVATGTYAKLSGSLYSPPLIDLERFAVQVHIEQAPDPENRITLGDKVDPLGLRRSRLSWRLGELERASVRGLLSLLTDEVRRLGIGSVQIDDWVTDQRLRWPDLEVKRHHMGSTRMSDVPQQGVVNPDCRVHGIDNLYIAGSSVFPTGGFANPTLTIVALALRLAEHLKAVLPRACGRRHFYGPLPVGSLRAKSDRLTSGGARDPA